MKSASSTLPDQSVNGVTAGVDWACDDHAVAVVDDRGREIARRTIAHSSAGLSGLLGLLDRHRVSDRAAGWAAGGDLVGGWDHRCGDQPKSGEESSGPLRLGWQQR